MPKQSSKPPSPQPLRRSLRPLLWPLLALSLGTPLVAGAAQGQAAGPVLRLFIWTDYIDPAVIRAFETQHGVRVKVTTYTSNEDMLAGLRAGEQYDVAVPTATFLPTLKAAGRIQPLRADRLPNLKNLAPEYGKLAQDPGNRYSAPYLFGGSGLLYRTDRVKDVAGRRSWGLVFGPRTDVRFALMDDPMEVFSAALKYLGHSVNTTDGFALLEARALIVKTARKPNFAGFLDSTTIRNRLLSGALDVGHGYAGDLALARGVTPKVSAFVPREGGLVNLDTLVVLRGANRNLAETFINHLYEPEVAARNAAYAGFGTPNVAARSLLSAGMRANPILFPAPETAARQEYPDHSASPALQQLLGDLKARR